MLSIPGTQKNQTMETTIVLKGQDNRTGLPVNQRTMTGIMTEHVTNICFIMVQPSHLNQNSEMANFCTAAWLTIWHSLQHCNPAKTSTVYVGHLDHTAGFSQNIWGFCFKFGDTPEPRWMVTSSFPLHPILK